VFKRYGKFFATPPNGESVCDVARRLIEFLDMMELNAKKNDISNIVIVSHALTINIIRLLLSQDSFKLINSREKIIKNCNIRRMSRRTNCRFIDRGNIFSGFL
jgi:broad specificity phosphatase PhoE